MTDAGAGIPTRIYGMETEYGIAAVPVDKDGKVADKLPALGMGAAGFSPEEAANFLFEPIRTRRKSTNRFLPNGSRIYLDIGAHPEYAGAECTDPMELLADDRAGEELFRDMVQAANRRLEEADRPARIYLFKNNADSEGTSFGSHENYLVRRVDDIDRKLESIISFLVTRQILTGSGHVRRNEAGEWEWSFSVRSDMVWDTVSKATTQERPMINSRDEPHSDAEKFRRLHVIVGDSTIAQPTTVLRFAMTSLVLDAIEAGVDFEDLSVVDPTAAIRRVAHGLSANVPLELVKGGRMTAVEIQEEFLTRVLRFLDESGARKTMVPGVALGLDLWERGVNAWRAGDLSPVATELDWVAKHRLVERYRERSGAALDDPRVERLLLAYHDVTSPQPMARALEERGGLRSLLTPEQVHAARTTPPQTTRAKLRGELMAEADKHDLDVFVDWVNLKVHWIGVRPIEIQDPFQTESAEVDAMIEAVASQELAGPRTPLIYG